MYQLEEARLSRHQLQQLQRLLDQLDLAPGPGGSRMSDRIATKALFDPVLGGCFFTRHPWSTTVIALYPSCQIVAHRDAPLTGLRYHVPLFTNPDAWVFHAGIWQQLEEGQFYLMDPTELHGAVNWGSEMRAHLIVDVER